MNVVVWARVSSREQREGYSIDAQLRATREKAKREGWHVAREFDVAESARRGAERLAFNDMVKWVRANARREKITAILSHKLDRVCRNMRDAVRLQELEDSCGVQLAFVENQFGPGAAGALSFNVMAAVAQYYSDNLRSEVLKGMDEKVRQGWPTGGAPYGYINVQDNHEEPVQPHPEKSRTIIRIFELYAYGDMTFQSLADALEREGHIYRPSQPRFTRTALSYVLNNRFYIGELLRNGQTFTGRYQRLITRELFEACQDILHGKNRRTGKPQIPLSGGLMRCAHCGFAITGERIKRKLKNGSVNEHLYYRCGNNHPDPGHPRVRWRAEDVESAITDELATLRIEPAEVRDLFRKTLAAAFEDISSQQRRQSAALSKRHSELAGMQDRLLNAYLAGTIAEGQYRDKAEELRSELAGVTEARERVGRIDAGAIELAFAVFDWCQNADEHWRRSNSAVRRRILDSVSLNRTLSDANLYLTKRKPFDLLIEGRESERSRGSAI
ncbi:MAG: recombinase family protein [Phycisphaerales bacterium]|nr:recombinase family protein [Phycisphaerales bacterium]